MGQQKEVGFFTGASQLWPLLLIATLGVLGYYGFAYLNPAVSVNSQSKTSSTATIRRNVVRTTTVTTPTVVGTLVVNTVTVMEERDLTTTNTDENSSNLVSSLSTPVFSPGYTYGVSVAIDPFSKDVQVGAILRPFDFLELGLKSNFRDKVFVEGNLFFK